MGTQNLSQSIAEELLKIQAVMLKPNPEDWFTWASGIKSPIYCNNRLTLSEPKTRELIKDSLVKLIQEKFPEAQAIAGVATAGIPHGALIADQMKLPFSYVRPKPKEHGTGDQIEGRIAPGARVVVIEDLISTGGSSLKAVDALKAAGIEVIGLAAIFSYNLAKAKQAFEDANLAYYTLSDYDSLLEVAQERGDIQAAELKVLQDWKNNLG